MNLLGFRNIILGLLWLATNAQAMPDNLLRITCHSGRNTLGITQIDKQSTKASIYLELMSPYIETYFDGEIVNGGRFIRINFTNSTSFILVDAEPNSNGRLDADLVLDAPVGHRNFSCLKK